MKISTALNFQRSLNTMQETQNQVSKTREQLATGKEIVRPSDDTIKVSAIETWIEQLPRKTPIKR